MKLLSSEQELWDKEIDIRLTLRELQELYCAFGTTAYCNRAEQWEELSTEDCPFVFSYPNTLYEDLESILKAQGGVTFNG